MRLLTANLYSGRASIGDFMRLLDREQPDLVGCVEVGERMAVALRERYPHGVVFGDDEGHTGHALLSPQAIDVDRLELPERPGLRTRIGLAGVEVEVAIVHLANPIDGPRAIDVRRRQVDTVIGHLDRVGTPALVAGDLNATPAWRAYRRLRHRLRDGIADAAREGEGEVRRTWSPLVGWPPLLRIDHILIAGLRLERVAQHRVDGTDHRALSATVVPVSP